MKIVYFGLIAILATLSAACAEPPELPSWLEGSWKLSTPTSLVEEYWTKPFRRHDVGNEPNYREW
jgi:hypothetical protein